MVFCKVRGAGKEGLFGPGSCLLTYWAGTSPGRMALFAIDAPSRLLGGPGRTSLVCMFLAGAPPAALLASANPGHMARSLTLVAPGDTAVPVEELS